MIKLTRGDILRADAEALVNTVNCVGFMGRGIALQFKHSFPENFRVYQAACKRGEVRPGSMLVVETGQLTNPRYIVNFPTKRHWRASSLMADIDAGLVALVAEVKDRGIRSIAVPPLGCGLGGLDWRDVRPRIERAFGALPEVHVSLFEPAGAPAASELARATKAPKMTSGKAALIGLMNRYLEGLLDPFVTLLEVHKLMYFDQEAGQPLRLRYVKGTFGPYAENLRHVLAEIEGHLLRGYGDGGDAPDKQLELLPGAIESATAILVEDAGARARFDRVADLLEGFETPFGLELLATVHWVSTREGATEPDATIEAVYAWNEDKRRFSPEQIRLARSVLTAKGWLDKPPASLSA